MLDLDFFLDHFDNGKSNDVIKFAKVDSSHVEGRPSLIFDGETVASVKKYPHLSSYIPAANDRVMLIKGVIIGKII